MAWSLMLWPLLAGVLVLLTHVPLGVRVLDRGIVFIDLAIAQIAGLGVIAGHAMGLQESGVAVQAVAIASALSGAIVLGWAERRAGRHQEALIGVTFVLAASAGTLLLAHDPHGGEHLQTLLLGQILWTDAGALVWLAALTALLLPSMLRQLRAPAAADGGGIFFYATFAVAVTASVQVVGVYLVFASLIIPALATRRLGGRSRVAAGLAIGVPGYALGLLASMLLDLPAGPVIVWVLTLIAVTVSVLVSVKLRGARRLQPTQQG